jgi:hypothetical protein
MISGRTVPGLQCVAKFALIAPIASGFLRTINGDFIEPIDKPPVRAAIFIFDQAI